MRKSNVKRKNGVSEILSNVMYINTYPFNDRVWEFPYMEILSL